MFDGRVRPWVDGEMHKANQARGSRLSNTWTVMNMGCLCLTTPHHVPTTIYYTIINDLGDSD